VVCLPIAIAIAGDMRDTLKSIIDPAEAIP
jgi:hypothetical protein